MRSYFLQLQGFTSVCLHKHLVGPTSPYIRKSKHFTNPPSPQRCLRNMWKPPNVKKLGLNISLVFRLYQKICFSAAALSSPPLFFVHDLWQWSSTRIKIMSQEKKGKEEEGVTFRYSSVFSLYKYIYVCMYSSLPGSSRESELANQPSICWENEG